MFAPPSNERDFDAVADTPGRVEGLCHRPEGPVDSTQEEDGARRVGKAHRTVAGDALEDRTGQLFPTLPTLLRIALVFSVGLDYFIAADRDKPVVGISRHQERLRFPDKAGGKDQAYEFESLDFPAVQRLLNSYFAEFFAVAPEKLSGTTIPARSSSTCCPARLTLHIGDEEHALEANDSIIFDSTVPHAYRKSGGKACCALVVTTG